MAINNNLYSTPCDLLRSQLTGERIKISDKTYDRKHLIRSKEVNDNQQKSMEG